MKKIILTFLLFLCISSIANAQGDRIYQVDSLYTGKLSSTFTIATKHNFNTFTLVGLETLDTVRVYHLNESGDVTPVSIRDLNTYTDLNTNLITGYSGNHEFLVLNPNIYKLMIIATATTVEDKTLNLRRRGNNLK